MRDSARRITRLYSLLRNSYRPAPWLARGRKSRFPRLDWMRA